MNERRKNQDRRNYESAEQHGSKRNRRASPDRRLNSISAVWIPIGNISMHPLTRGLFGKH